MSKILKLQRQDVKKLNFGEMGAMKKNLEQWLFGSSNISNWKEIVRELIQFQDTDGSFRLMNTYRCDGDCRVDYCLEPTYICTALLMKALLVDEQILAGKEDIILSGAMKICCARGLQGSGYDALEGLLRGVKYFITIDVCAFLEKYPDLCPEFTEMFRRIENHFAERVEQQDFTTGWGENYEKEIRECHEYFEGKKRLK